MTAMKSDERRRGVYAGLVGRARRLAGQLGIFFVVLSVLCWFFGKTPDGGAIESPWDATYLALRMFFAGPAAEETAHPLMQTFRLVTPLVLPLFGVFAAVKSVGVRWSLFWRKHLYAFASLVGLRDLLWGSLAADLVVVIGLGDKGRETVLGELQQGGTKGFRPTTVVVLERSDDNPSVAEVESLGALVWAGEGESDHDLRVVLWKAPIRVWVMTGSSRSNLMVLQKVADLSGGVDYGSRQRARGQRTDIYAHINSFEERRDAGLIQPLNHDREHIWTHVFNHDEKVAERLLALHPMTVTASGDVPRVLLLGLGGVGMAILRELMLLCHFPESEQRFDEVSRRLAQSPFDPPVEPGELREARFPAVVMADAAADVRERIAGELPFLGRPIEGVSPFLATRLVTENVLNWDFNHYREGIRQGVPFSHVFIVMGSEVNNIVMAERIWAWERILASETSDAMPSIVPMIYDSDAADWMTVPPGCGLEHFEAKKVLLLRADSMDGEVLSVAERINHVYGNTDYLKGKTTEKPDWGVNGQTAAWTRCLEHNRRSSLAAARYYIGRKGVVSGVDERMEAAIRCEHRRWIGYTLVESVTRVGEPAATVALMDENLRRVIGDRSPRIPRDVAVPKLRQLARTNKNLVPFDELPEHERNKDAVIVCNQSYVLGRSDAPVVLGASTGAD